MKELVLNVVKNTISSQGWEYNRDLDTDGYSINFYASDIFVNMIIDDTDVQIIAIAPKNIIINENLLSYKILNDVNVGLYAGLHLQIRNINGENCLLCIHYPIKHEVILADNEITNTAIYAVINAIEIYTKQITCNV